MCSIFGAYGHPDSRVVATLGRAAGDRGRDGGRVEWYDLEDGKRAVLGNWRATPTPELMHVRLQPYDGLVHNGTVANDEDLGIQEGEVDSMVLARILHRTKGDRLAESLLKVKGSYALGIYSQVADTVFLACNYKPIYLWSPDQVTWYFSSMARHFEDVCPPGQAPVKMTPYTVIDLKRQQTWRLPRKFSKRVVVVASGGLDSTVVAAKYVSEGWDVSMLHFRYGCRAESREWGRVKEIARLLGCRAKVLDIPYDQIEEVGSPLLTPGAGIAEGVAGAEYAHEWVPARNLAMLALAAAYAEGYGYHVLALGNNLEEAGAYPDNEEEMTVLLDAVLDYAVQNGYELRVQAPVGHLMKHEIVKLGVDLGAPLGRTWSCYQGGETHCGECGPCFMRKTAFARNGMIDPVFVETSDVEA